MENIFQRRVEKSGIEAKTIARKGSWLPIRPDRSHR
jgi:hypothetical protein